jgi:predicted RNA binding protein YcfA (HicA-like mRNA interferase family)
VAEDLPAITGKQLERLFRLDGWEPKRRAQEETFFAKKDAAGVVRHTVITTKNRPLASGTLTAMLGPKQSNVGRDGLREMIRRHGLK